MEVCVKDKGPQYGKRAFGKLPERSKHIHIVTLFAK